MSLPAGSTLLIRPSVHLTKHLFVLVLEANQQGKTLIVNFTTAREFSDRTTVLHEGDHPFIKHETVVDYQDACITTIAKLEEAVQTGVAETYQPISSELLKKIQSDVLRSPRTKNKIKAFVQETETSTGNSSSSETAIKSAITPIKPTQNKKEQSA